MKPTQNWSTVDSDFEVTLSGFIGSLEPELPEDPIEPPVEEEEDDKGGKNININIDDW